MRRVYITNRGFHNYQPAQRFGELVAVTSGSVNLKAPDRIEADVQRALRDYKEGDALLLSGHLLINVMAVGYLLNNLGHKKLNIVYHDNQSPSVYLERKMDFADLRGTLDGEGAIHCPRCGDVIAEAPVGVTATASDPCWRCVAEIEEEAESEMNPIGRRVR